MKPTNDSASPGFAEPIARLRILATDALRIALGADANGGSEEGELHALLAEACSIARSCDVRAEQVLIVLKEAWRDLAERERAASATPGEVIARVVSLCIAEYFAPGRGTGTSTATRR